MKALMTAEEIRALGYRPTWRGWTPITEETKSALDDADRRRTASRHWPPPFVVSGDPQPCIVCERPADPSLVGTPTCSAICTAILAEETFADPRALAAFRSRDGVARALPPPVLVPPRPPAPAGAASVDRAREHLGTCADVLERHARRVRGRMALCVHHDERTPSMSLFERDGISRFHCFGCDAHGDVIDLEAHLAGESLTDTIRRWGR